VTIPSDPIHDHVTLVRAAAAGGAVIPAEWEALRQRLDNLTNIGGNHNPMLDRLISALIDGTDADIPALYAAALAEANDTAKGKVVGPTRHAVLAKMRALYGKAATKNFGLVGAKFNETAKQFADRATLIDPETTALAIIDALAETDNPDEVRQAWNDVESYAHRLDELVPALATAAALAGIPNTDTEPVLLALVCHPGDKHRRRVWEAWTSQGTCGKWAALHRLGVTIRAYRADQVASFINYPEPKEIEHRLTPVPGQIGVYTTTQHDPESADYTPPDEPNRAMIPGRRLVTG
jgi:hypothetical protein